MNWFIDPIKTHYVDFDGRAMRKPFWLFTLISIVISSILDMVDGSTAPSILSGVFSLAILLPSLAIGGRRLHDTGRSGWWQLLWFVPIVGWIILIVWLATDSTADTKYGPNPKGVTPEPVQTPASVTEVTPTTPAAN